MDRTDFLGMLVLTLAVTIGFLFGRVLGYARGGSCKEQETLHWVEECWPNKPVWTEGPGTCWVNGQKVVQ